MGTQGGRKVVEGAAISAQSTVIPIIIKGFWDSLKTDENRNILFAGVSSWENPQTDQVSEGLQQLFGNISQLFEKGILGRDGEETWGSAGVSYVA